jgi:hypothetical protein
MTGVALCTELGDLYESRLTARERSGCRKESALGSLTLWNANRAA